MSKLARKLIGEGEGEDDDGMVRSLAKLATKRPEPPPPPEWMSGYGRGRAVLRRRFRGQHDQVQPHAGRNGRVIKFNSRSMALVTDHNVQFMISYNTPIAYYANGVIHQTENRFSSTTGRHKSLFRRHRNYPEVVEHPQEFIRAAWLDFQEEANLSVREQDALARIGRRGYY